MTTGPKYINPLFLRYYPPVKWWKRVLLMMPNAGIAYRAYRWVRFIRKRQLIKLVRLWRRFCKQLEENPEMLFKALKSKTIWLGIISSAWGLVQGFMAAGDFSREALVALGTGILIIVLRTITTQPLEDK